MAFDLDAYLERIRLAPAPIVDPQGLAELQFAHRQALPFENLDVRLGRPIRIDSDSVFDKLVTRRRGGYCFEHNRLFLDALEALGFTARPLMARSWFGGITEVQPRTHTLSLVTIGDTDYVADPGFGGSYTPVMPLVDGAELTAPDGARFRLTTDADHGWMLWRDGDPALTDGRGKGSSWEKQYSFTLEAAWPGDMAMGNHWSHTASEARFVKNVIVSIILPHGFARFTDRDYRRRSAGEDARSEVTDPRVYRMRLSLMFGIDLTAEEVAGLGLFAAAD